jgi:transcriptional regulator of heat shock response
VGCAVSLVAAGYRDEDGAPGGALGIIGPQRMDYPFVVPLVGATADAMSGALAKKRDTDRS